MAEFDSNDSESRRLDDDLTVVQWRTERDSRQDRGMSSISEEIRALFDAPNFVHLSTLRRDGTPRNWIVWVGLEGDQILVCTSERQAKATDMRRDPRVGLSVADSANPYRMAVVQGRVVEERPDHDCVYMDPIAIKYTSAPFPSRGPRRICLVISVEHAWERTLAFPHRPG